MKNQLLPHREVISVDYKKPVVNVLDRLNRLTPNDLYMSRTAPLTSKR